MSSKFDQPSGTVYVSVGLKTFVVYVPAAIGPRHDPPSTFGHGTGVGLAIDAALVDGPDAGANEVLAGGAASCVWPLVGLVVSAHAHTTVPNAIAAQILSNPLPMLASDRHDSRGR